MGTSASAFMLIIHDAPQATYDALPPEERRESMQRWNGWVDGMAAEGKLVDGHPLEAARRIVSGARSARVRDGPFAETKELVGGYFLLTDISLDEATSIALRCPSLRHGMTVEIRPIAGACHVARSLGWETMREPVGD
jgi:hypothetical protein